MSAISEVLRAAEGDYLLFWCPGCNMAHQIRHGGPGRWRWNGDAVRPTFSPSVLVTWEEGPARTPRVCHSFVEDGRIRFLADSTHALAGQTVDLPEKWSP